MVSELKLSTGAANAIADFLLPWYRLNIGWYWQGKTSGEKGQDRGEFSGKRGEGGGNRRLHLTLPWIKPETMVRVRRLAEIESPEDLDVVGTVVEQ